ncbi:MAG TPA: arginine--tRNA ligase, partial [Patescibacteria group bacterium]
MLSYKPIIKEEILKNLQVVLGKMKVKNVDTELDHPANPDFGDYSTSVALKLTKILKKNPFEIAQEIVKNLSKNINIKKVEIIKPGFINFWIADGFLVKNISNMLENEQINYPKYYLGKNKKVMVEFAHPNTHKLFHIGHLRNISIGEAIVRILEATGNKVIRANYQGDVGLHIAKCLYGIINSKIDIKKIKTFQKKIEFIGKMYSFGT